MRKIFLFTVAIFALLFVVLNFSQRKESVQPKTLNKSESTARSSIVAQNLEIPWGLAFLPNGNILVTERLGRVNLVQKDAMPAGRQGNVQQVAQLSNVKHIGEGGLMGIALHPDFKLNNYLYLYYTYGGETLNRVVRMTYKDEKLENERIIVDKIPGSANHNGGRIKFGPDKLLYIGTGDSQNPSQAQDTNSLAGKILRVTDEGKVPKDNFFNNPVYSYGHRNVQGLAWDSNGNLWATEHGSSAHDELNRIERGKNYGWPDIRGNEQRPGMERPLLESGNDTWAPAGAAFYNDSIFFAGLRGATLYEYKINERKLLEHFKNEYGRLRDVVLGPDEMLYITTSNRDGRGSARSGDDKIIRVDPTKL